jgi:hypothetical protein
VVSVGVFSLSHSERGDNHVFIEGFRVEFEGVVRSRGLGQACAGARPFGRGGGSRQCSTHFVLVQVFNSELRDVFIRVEMAGPLRVEYAFTEVRDSPHILDFAFL